MCLEFSDESIGKALQPPQFEAIAEQQGFSENGMLGDVIEESGLIQSQAQDTQERGGKRALPALRQAVDPEIQQIQVAQAPENQSLHQALVSQAQVGTRQIFIEQMVGKPFFFLPLAENRVGQPA